MADRTEEMKPERTRAGAGARWRVLKRICAGYLVLLLAVPFVFLLFSGAGRYQDALRFILPGIGTTLLVTVLAYIAAAVLGLALAAILLLRSAEKTLARHLVAAVILALVSAWFFTRPQTEYVLVGEPEGLVAIIQGTPQRLTDAVQHGLWADEELPSRNIRAVTGPEAAVERLENEIVTGAFMPADLVPEGLPVLWSATFLPKGSQMPALFFGVLAAVLLALVFAGWQSGKHPLAIFAELYVDMIRGIPMLVIILYVGFPIQGAIRDLSGGAVEPDRLTRGVIAIALGYAAYMAEIFRAGIQAVPRGQIEAARSLGLSGMQTARFIVLPQALRIVIPPLGNEFIAMLKDTSLLSLLSLREITQRGREFTARTFEYFPGYNTVAIIYIGLTLAAASLLKYVERHSRRSEAAR